MNKWMDFNICNEYEINGEIKFDDNTGILFLKE